MIDRDRIIADARAAFGHIDGRSDVDCLVLMVSMLRRHTAERNAALSENARQAAMIGGLNRRLAEKTA